MSKTNKLIRAKLKMHLTPAISATGYLVPMSERNFLDGLEKIFKFLKSTLKSNTFYDWNYLEKLKESSVENNNKLYASIINSLHNVVILIEYITNKLVKDSIEDIKVFFNEYILKYPACMLDEWRSIGEISKSIFRSKLENENVDVNKNYAYEEKIIESFAILVLTAKKMEK